VKRLSIDEISQRKGHQDFATVVCDIDRGKLLEVIDSHHQSDIIEVLRQQPLELRSSGRGSECGYVGRIPQSCARSLSQCQLGI